MEKDSIKEFEEENKKKYVPPTLDVTMVEMEQGIAAGSSAVSPGVAVDGSVEAVDTSWDSQDDTDISTQF